MNEKNEVNMSIDHNVRKYRFLNTVSASFNTSVGQMIEMSQ